jgi:hypothetical protein
VRYKYLARSIELHLVNPQGELARMHEMLPLKLPVQHRLHEPHVTFYFLFFLFRVAGNSIRI